MAVYHPSLQPPASLSAGGRSSHPHHLSPTPPPLSKRDKRRNAMMDRLQEISSNFAENRDYHYRRQLQELQCDLNLITRAEPYRNQPLEEVVDDANDDTSVSAAGTRGGQYGPTTGANERQPKVGKWGRRFIEEVNYAMEDRDAQLSLVVERHNSRIRELTEDYDYGTKVAEKECTSLLTNLRTRYTKMVSDKRAALLKERDKPDTSDITSSFFVNQSQFSFANPASPGGPLSNRKTRHTRHRLEVEDTGPGSDNKRKRKLAGDADEGSPGPSSRIVDVEAPVSSKDARSKSDVYHQPLTSAYSMDALFNDKELIMTTQEASYAAVQEILSQRKRNKTFDKEALRKIEASTQKPVPNGRKSIKPSSTTNPTTANVTDAEDDAEDIPPQIDGADEDSSDDVFLTAPAMDRTANSSFYATRSTRNNHLNYLSNGSPLQTLGDLAGRASAVKYLGTYPKDRKQSSEEYNRAPPLTDQEVDDDLALIAAAMKEGEASPGKMNLKLVEDLYLEQVDYTNEGGGAVSDMRGSRRSSISA
ncbi:MAG: hypothetical protein LQ341_004340 [Variospora aurantia]|nr:MAG: hypothetical protein LQ341_004340 [Variospora aurantia]